MMRTWLPAALSLVFACDQKTRVEPLRGLPISESASFFQLSHKDRVDEFKRQSRENQLAIALAGLERHPTHQEWLERFVCNDDGTTWTSINDKLSTADDWIVSYLALGLRLARRPPEPASLRESVLQNLQRRIDKMEPSPYRDVAEREKRHLERGVDDRRECEGR